MPDTYGPFDASTFAQGQFYRDRGQLHPSGVLGTPSATAAGGELGLTAAGFALTLALGRAHVRGAAYERTGTAFTYTVPANSSGVGPRNDLLVLRRDLVAKTVVPTYVQGTAAASPTDPAVTRAEDGTWDLPLFRVQAPPSSGTPLVLTDLRPFLPQNGGRLVVPGSAARDALPATAGLEVVRLDNDNVEKVNAAGTWVKVGGRAEDLLRNTNAGSSGAAGTGFNASVLSGTVTPTVASALAYMKVTIGLGISGSVIGSVTITLDGTTVDSTIINTPANGTTLTLGGHFPGVLAAGSRTWSINFTNTSGGGSMTLQWSSVVITA